MRRHHTALPCLTALALLLLSVVASGCSDAGSRASTGPLAASAAPVELNISAATSLKKVFEKIGPDFERENSVKLVFNFGASGQLQKQIERGAPADVFVSASPSQVDSLSAQGLISADETSTVAGNDLVVFVTQGNPLNITGPDDLSEVARLTTGNPDTAPHGTKAREWLTGLGTWESLQPKFVFAENAAQTLDYVSRGEADAGIGFASEATSNAGVEIVYTVPKGEIKPVKYVAAPLRDTGHIETAKAFIEWLSSPGVQERLTAAGFLPAPSE